ncbi:hypothetical protein [Siphonobacter sp.]|uniref:hypothetical protein n=1 Tax=Siphonobacter sp. TaxID=1869184 RepID=UPI003B3A8B4D
MRTIQLREERNFSEIINVTFQFTFQNLRTLGPILLYFAAPFSLISGIATGLYQSQLFSSGLGLAGATRFSNFFGPSYLMSILFSLLASITISLVVSSYLVRYMDSDEPIEPAEVWRIVLRHLLPTLLLYVIYGFTLLLGFVLCFLPVAYPYTTFSLGTISLVREERRPSQALQRSHELVTMSWGDALTTFGIRILVTLAASFLGGILSIPMYLVMFLQTLKVVGDDLQWVTMLSSIIAVTGTTILSALVDVALGFQYFSLVEKKEGIGLMQEIEAIGQQNRRDDAY